MNKITLLRVAAVVCVVLFFVQAYAQTPRTLSYQGVLTDANGNAKEFEAPKQDFTFRLYADTTGSSSIWSESKSLFVNDRGFFATMLGDETPFADTLRFDQPLWLGVQIGDEVLSPLIPLTGAGFSFNAARADTADFALTGAGGSGDSTWTTDGDNVYRAQGRVGIGTSDPAAKLHVKGPGSHVIFERNGTANDPVLDVRGGPDGSELHFRVQENGNIGVGVENPRAPLHVGGKRAGGILIDASTLGNEITFSNVGGDDPANIVHEGLAPIVFSVRVNEETHERMRIDPNGGIMIQTGLGAKELQFSDAGADPANIVHRGDNAPIIFETSVNNNRIERMRIHGNGNIGIGTTAPVSKLHVEGTTTTKVLAITGGGDITEPFEISDSDVFAPGIVVVIDPENPGKLRQATRAYDRRVAGIISGAGGVNTGLTLAQNDVFSAGQNVALTGRVYALATAANGRIEPGDLLTTSTVPGHAMKATNGKKSHGAVIGKAMSGLEKGEGLVLVLVNLQ